MKYGWILALVFLALLFSAAAALVLFVKRKTREISRTLWGKDTLAEGVAQMKKELSLIHI